MFAALALAATVTVSPGNTLSGIASHHGITWEQLWYANQKQISNPNLIFPGQKLVIPGRHSPSKYPAAGPASMPVLSGHGTTAVTVSSTPVSSTPGGNLSYSGLEALWESAGGPAWAAAHAAEIAECESGGRQYAYNPSGASGYWQILGQVVPGNVYDPIVNAENAVAKFRASGQTFAQWVCT